MKDSFEYSLLESGSIIKKGYSILLRNMGKTVALITAIVAVLVTFTEIGFYSFGTKEVASSALVLLIASYLIYFSLEDAGEKLAKEGDSYKRICEEHESVKSKIQGGDMPALRSFCERYKREELKHRIGSILIAGGVSGEEYEKYKDKLGSAPSSIRRSIRVAAKQRPLGFDAKDLLHRGRNASRDEIRNPERSKLLKLCLGLVPSTVCTLLTVSLVLTSKDSLTFASVVESTLKLASLPVVGLRGYSAGYSYIKDEAEFWIETKTRLICTFLEQNKNNCK